MSIKKMIAVPALLSALCLATSPVFAQGEDEMTDEKFCEQEARQEGLSDAGDIREHMEQCLNDIRQENAGSGAGSSASE